MGPAGTPIGSAQSVLSPVVLQSNAAILGSQGGPIPPQATFSSINLPQSQYNMNLIGNNANISSLLNQSYGNGGKITGLSGLGGSQLGNPNAVADSDLCSTVATDVGFTAAQSSFMVSNMANSGSSGQVQNQQMSNSSGNALLLDQPQSHHVQKFEQWNLQHVQQSMQQFPTSNSQPQPQQPQFQSIRGSLGGMAPIKLGPQTMNNHIGSQQQLHLLGNHGPGNQELQQNLIGRGIGPVKAGQHSDQSVLLPRQQQHQQHQQQLFHLPRQSSQGAVSQMNLLQQQRVLQLQQQRQQQLLKALPQQQAQQQQHVQHHNLPSGSAVRPVYEPGMCARRLTQYMYQQQQRPNDNSVEFWQKFVAEFFAPNARKSWCVSLYGSSRQTNGVFPQDTWQCEICSHKPGRGFEATVEVLPRLFKVKYDSGTLEELLYVDMPREYQNATGQIVLDYAKAIQESVFNQLRVVRDGRLRIVFSPDLKICSWEFCARHHEELIPRRLIMPPVSQLGTAAQKYQASAASHPCSPDLQSNCNTFVTSARQLAKALEVPLVNDLGYTKRFIRCLQIAEVVNGMKDLIDSTWGTGKGPMETLAQFARRTTADPSSVLHLPQRPEEQQQVMGENLNNDHHSVQASAVQPSISNGAASVSNSHCLSSTSSSNTAIAGLLRRNSMNSRIENQINNPNSLYVGTPVQIPSAGSSTTLPPAQTNPSSPFSCPTPSSSNNPPRSSQNAVTASATANNISLVNSSAQTPVQLSSQSNGVDPNESDNAFEKVIQEILDSSQLGATDNTAVSVQNNVKGINGLTQLSHNSINSGNGLAHNGIVNGNSDIVSGGLGNLGVAMSLSAAANGIRGTNANNFGTFTGRAGMLTTPQHGSSMSHQQQELVNWSHNGLGTVNGFNNFQSEWKLP